jgi:single-strand DNA-binding protein
MNRVCLVGHLAVDPELRYTASGVAVAAFRVAVRDVFRKTETGDYAADFFEVRLWRKQAEYASNYLAKGALVAVQGRLAINEWTAQDGTKRRSYYVSGDQIESLSRPASHGAPAPQEATATPSPATTTRDAPEEYHTDDPFADE